jgi:hypothetical protein
MRFIQTLTLTSSHIKKSQKSLWNSNHSILTVCINRGNLRFSPRNRLFNPLYVSQVRNLPNTGRNKRGWYPQISMICCVPPRKLSFFSVLSSLRQIPIARLIALLRTNVLSYMNKQCRKCGSEGSPSKGGTRPASSTSTNAHKTSSRLSPSCAIPAEMQITTCRNRIPRSRLKKCSLQHPLRVLKGIRLPQRESRRHRWGEIMRGVKFYRHKWLWVATRGHTKIHSLTFHTQSRKNTVGIKEK